MNPATAIQTWWNRLHQLPGGKLVFSAIIGRMAPYTGTVGARIEELAPGYSRWTLRDRRKIRNHLHSIHAVALVNFAEVTTGTAMMMALPNDVRGIVRALAIEYVKKARGTLVAECRCTVPRVTQNTSFDVHADVRDATGDVVAHATVTWLLSPR
jgi:acyl-coenzyme A thioesterase PaaI-like protein